jgi:hypothetical protein
MKKPTKRKATKQHRPTPLDTQDQRTCFAIMPFSVKPDAARGDTLDFDTDVYDKIIEPAVDLAQDEGGLKITVTRADKVLRAGSIHERMIQFIAESDVAIVDITTANPNVFYELGVRHALRDRVTVLIRRRGTKNPFNIAGLAAIDYDEKRPLGARRTIAAFIRNGLLSGSRDSLVYGMLPELRVETRRPPVIASDVEEYEHPGLRGKRIGMVMGDLRNANLTAALRTNPIDVWVNSENVNMSMARPYEGSISATIRYLGARKDETGAIVDDIIANELKRKMRGRQIVNPAEVVATGAGRLSETHQVKQIFHAAAVYGVVGFGFHPIVGVEQCVTNALVRMDFDPTKSVHRTGGHNAPDASLGSILFPLFGSGTARAELIQSARKQVDAAVRYLKSRAEFTRVSRVFFLALTAVHCAALRVTFAEQGLTRVRGTSRRQQTPAARKTAKTSRARSAAT